MTRKEWRKQQVSLGTNKKRPKLTGSEISAILKDIYGLYLEEKERIEYDLIQKYKQKVSLRFQTRLAKLDVKGKFQARQLYSDLVFCKNPLLKMVRKNEKS